MQREAEKLFLWGAAVWTEKCAMQRSEKEMEGETESWLEKTVLIK